MAKIKAVSVSDKRELIKAKRRELVNLFNGFCKTIMVCPRCKNPEKVVPAGSSLCPDCAAYYKQYNSELRGKDKDVKVSSKKVTSKKAASPKQVAVPKVKAKGAPKTAEAKKRGRPKKVA